VAMERTIAYVPATALKIIHAPFANADYVQTVYEAAFGADAVTLSAFIDLTSVQTYIQDVSHGVFIEQRTPSTTAHPNDFIGEGAGWYTYSAETARGKLTLPSCATTLLWVTDAAIYPGYAADFRDPIREAARRFAREAAELANEAGQ
jgi:hypothetical protein